MERFLHNYWFVFSGEYVAHLFRYGLVAGMAYLVFYVVWRRKTLRRKIQGFFPRRADIRREIFFSLTSFGIFALVGVLTVYLRKLGWVQLYLDVNEYGWGYLLLSVAALIVIHDTWFYWTHRLMHTRRLFPIMHRVHHLSHNPTPWAAFAFHPLEAVVEALVFPIAALFLPIHPLAAALWLGYMTLMNVFGHLGFEILPRGFVKHRVMRWHNTSVHHNMHHRHVNCNYGLYFNFWDRMMKTNHSHYEAEFECVTTRPSDFRLETMGSAATLQRAMDEVPQVNSNAASRTAAD